LGGDRSTQQISISGNRREWNNFTLDGMNNTEVDFNTYLFLQKTTAPVTIFHGDADKVFYYGSSEKLKAFFKPEDQLITLKWASHFDFESNKYYLEKLQEVLK